MDFMQMLQQMFGGGNTMDSSKMQWDAMAKQNEGVLKNLVNNGDSNPLTGGFDNSGLNDGFGMNMGTAKFGMGALSSLGSLWGAYNQNKLANAQFDFQKQMANSNLNNQIKSYNTALADRANTRAVMHGKDQSWADQYINDNKLVK